MTALPLRFGENSFSYLDRTSFSYSFDKITGITVNEDYELPFKQTYEIPALSIELEGRTANPNMSISLNGLTEVYNLQQLFISSHHPIVKDNALNSKHYSLVIEGYSNADVQKSKLLIFIPIDPAGVVSTGLNSFNSMNMLFSFLNDNTANVTVNSDRTKTLSGIDLNINELIPNEQFYLYQKTDNNSVNFTVIFFNTSKLFTSSKTKSYFTKAFSSNKAEIEYNKLDEEQNNTSFEDTTRNFLLYKSNVKPTKQASITTSFEDDIYIDCQPVDVANKEKTFYFQKFEGYGDFMQVGFVYLFTIIFISILVYFIYNIKTIFKPPSTHTHDAIKTMVDLSKIVK
jgi:hypothetical protein